MLERNFIVIEKTCVRFFIETKMLDFKPIERLMEMNHRLKKLFDQVLANIGQYQRFVGKLIYLSHTRLDITYDMSMVNQFMRVIGEEHMKVVFRILRYLRLFSVKDFCLQKTIILLLKI